MTIPRLWLVGALVLHLVPFLARPALIGGDEPHYALMAHSLAVDGDTDLADDYAEVAEGARSAGRMRAGQVLDPHVREVGGRNVFAHPLGLPLLAAPVVAIQQAILPGSAPDLPLMLLTLSATFAALWAGLGALGDLCGDHRRGALAGLGLYFSTPLWFYSRTFTTEPYIWSWCVLAVAGIGRGRRWWASVFLALALAMKESAVLLVGPILLAALVVQGLRRAWPLFVGPALFAMFFAAKNLLSGLPVGSTFQPYATGGTAEGLWGLLVDPQRGLLWFAPLALAAWLAWPWLTPRPTLGTVTAAAAAMVLGYYLLSALWIDWRGGACYGPRLLVPILPIAALPLLRFTQLPFGRWRGALLTVAFVFGFVVNACAAAKPVQAYWSISVVDLVLGNPFVALVALAISGGLVVSVRRLGYFRTKPTS